MTEPMTWICAFDEPPPGEAAGWNASGLFGGKGASLRAMAAAGLTVPPGFTITTECCARYFELDRQWPEGLEAQLQQQMAALEQRTGRRFGRGRRPLLVSVRSGAAASMPGMMDTLLNCGLHPALADAVGDTPRFWHLLMQFLHSYARIVDRLGESEATALEPEDEDDSDRAAAEARLQQYRRITGRAFPDDPWQILGNCISAVFDSWLNPRAIAYRQRHGIHDLAGTAVNVQAMFPSQVSGIVFTRDPNDPRSERMVIESLYGLGEAVVSGDVTPDRFMVHREDPGDVESHIGHKGHAVAALGERIDRAPDAPSLDEGQIRTLHELAMKVERHFGHPVDIEWGLANGDIALLQARAIRGLEVLEHVEAVREREKKRLAELAGNRHRNWVAHNLGETLRHPTPMTWDLTRRFMTGDGGFGRLYRDLGYRPSPTAQREGFLELIGGRIYADPERLPEMFFDAMPLRYDQAELETDRSVLDRAPAKFDPHRADNRFLMQLPANIAAMFRVRKRMKRGAIDARERFEEKVLPPFLEWVRQKRNMSLDGLDAPALLDEFEARRRQVLDEFAPESLRPGFFGSLAFDELASLLKLIMGEVEAADWLGRLTRGLEGDTTFEQDALLDRIAHGQESLETFMERYGHRAINEMELSVPRWREDLTYVKRTIERLRSGVGHDPEAMHHHNVEQRQEAERRLPEALARYGAGSLYRRIAPLVARTQALLPYRESGKHYLMMGYEVLRDVLAAIGRRLELGAAVYFLTQDELSRYTAQRAELDDTIAQRRLDWAACQRLQMPDLIDSKHLDDLGLAREVEGGDELAGTAVASGVGEGTVRIVYDPAAAGDLGEDYVLVCPSTDPGWTPLFLHAAALVVERGGMLSHGAIVARDFGIPAVVLPDATRLLSDGCRARVDGNRGRVSILARDENNSKQPTAEAIHA